MIQFKTFEADVRLLDGHVIGCRWDGTTLVLTGLPNAEEALAVVRVLPELPSAGGGRGAAVPAGVARNGADCPEAGRKQASGGEEAGEGPPARRARPATAPAEAGGPKKPEENPSVSEAKKLKENPRVSAADLGPLPVWAGGPEDPPKAPGEPARAEDGNGHDDASEYRAASRLGDVVAICKRRGLRTESAILEECRRVRPRVEMLAEMPLAELERRIKKVIPNVPNPE